MRNYSATIIPVLWFSLSGNPGWGQTPEEAAGRFGQGVTAYERQDYAAAVRVLQQAQPELPVLADYIAYYLAAARIDSNQGDFAASDLAPLHRADLRSPLAGKAWLLEGRALQAGRPADSARVLFDHYSELPQPDGDLLLAESFRLAGDLARAARYYQQIHYASRSPEAVAMADAALASLKQTMGSRYPQPSPELLLLHADRLSAAKEYLRARSEYRAVSAKPGLAGEQAQIRLAVVDYETGKVAGARRGLQGLTLAAPAADAERLFYLSECARKLNDEPAIAASIAALGEKYPRSPWRLKALVASANSYLVQNRAEDFLPLYRAAYQDFPNEPAAGLWHWKVAFQAYLRDATDSVALLREHLERYGTHNTADAALYFLGRRAERDGQPGAARVYYEKLAQTFPNHYYAILARERLRAPAVAAMVAAPDAQQFAASLRLREAKPFSTEASQATSVRQERARLLRAAGLRALADAELRFGARTDGQPAILAMELAESADTPHLAIRIMKSLTPEYLNLAMDQAPRRYWDLLFPLPFRTELEQNARGEGLDPFLVAGLIRQESEFDPKALSKAKAYGLTQIRPVTGREFARSAGIQRLAPRQLFQPAVNLKIGTSILRSMLDRNSGRVEETLAAYNAGPARLAKWSAWSTYREPAEFVESIPFTETRDYVEAVMRNADIYRRLYP